MLRYYVADGGGSVKGKVGFCLEELIAFRNEAWKVAEIRFSLWNEFSNIDDMLENIRVAGCSMLTLFCM